VDAVNNKAERLKEATMAALQAVGGRMNMVNLNKALFYADLYALLRHGETITGHEYLALPMGPCVASYDKRIVRALVKAGLAEQLTDAGGYGKPLQVVHPLDDFPHLSQEQVDIVVKLALEAADATAKELSEHSHKNPGWILAKVETDRRNGQAQPINMRFALQQLEDDEDDVAWIRGGKLSPDEQATVAEGERDRVTDWDF
jgi:hypothetical protein